MPICDIALCSVAWLGLGLLGFALLCFALLCFAFCCVVLRCLVLLCFRFLVFGLQYRYFLLVQSDVILVQTGNSVILMHSISRPSLNLYIMVSFFVISIQHFLFCSSLLHYQMETGLHHGLHHGKKKFNCDRACTLTELRSATLSIRPPECDLPMNFTVFKAGKTSTKCTCRVTPRKFRSCRYGTGTLVATSRPLHYGRGLVPNP